MALFTSAKGYFEVTAVSFSPNVITVGEETTYSVTIKNVSGKKIRWILDDDSSKTHTASISNGITVTNGSWNVRTGPGSTYESVGTVRKGEVLQKMDIGDWLPVVFNGKVRYISPKAVK